MYDGGISVAARVLGGSYVRDNYPGKLPLLPRCEGSEKRREAHGQAELPVPGCSKQFQYEYTKAGCRPEARQLVMKLLVRNSGIRDIEEVTGVRRQTVLRWLNQKAESLEVKPRLRAYKSVQIDEVWTFVKERKRRKRWLFYAYAPETDEVLAWSWGNRSRHTAAKLYRQLQALETERFCTDDWPAFAKVLPPEKHLVGKAHTRNIEG